MSTTTNFGRLFKVFVSLATTILLVSCGGSSQYSGTEIEFSQGAFAETLVEAQITTQFAEIYRSVLPSLTADQVGGKTLFAPTNDALDKYLVDNSETLEGIISKPDLALSIVLGHLLGQEISATSLLNMNGESLAMLSGATFTIDTSTGATQLGNESGLKSKIIAIDLVSTDGVVHIVDAVLQP
jgi:uncharacterized surface protein with fasciclin (FAS1) repeats